MKTTTTFVYNVLAAVALLLCSMQVFTQNCVSCNNNVIDTLKFSSAIGTENISTGINSFASGYQNQALGDYSFASGYQSEAIGNYSVAAPFFSKAFGQRSIALGYYSTSQGSGSIALGTYSHTNSNAVLSIAIGSYVSSQNKHSIIMGFGSEDTLKNFIEKSLIIGFNSNLPTLFVGTSAGSGKTGRIGIGNVTSPQAKLHILADENEAADLILEHRTTGNNQVAKFILGTHSIVASANNNMIFTTPTNAQHFHFEKGNIRSENGTELLPAYSFTGSPNTGMFRPSQNTIGFSTGSTERLRITGAGNVGIGTSQPQAKLHVHGDFQVGDTANPQNMRLYGSINATGEYATAFGNGNIASGNYSFAGGFNSQATGNYSFASGYNSLANGNHSIAIGKQASAIGVEAFAFGLQTEASGNASFAIGPYSKTLENALLSIAIGSKVTSAEERCITIGFGLYESPLINSIKNSLMIGFNSNLPTFFVGPSEGTGTTGRIGIGNVTDPQAKLHIRADANEHATLRLEATGSDKHARINFTDAHQILASANDDMHFHTAEGKGYIFHDGDIYLSDIQSGIIMKSPNGQCWRGMLSDNGQLVFSVVTCPDGAVNVPKPSIEPALQMKIYPNPTDGTITIEVPDGVTNADWSLRSTDGALLMRNRITSDKTEISLAHFVPGVYVISIEQNGRIIASEKVVKQ